MTIPKVSKLSSTKKVKTKYPQLSKTSTTSKPTAKFKLSRNLLYVKVYGTIRVFKDDKVIVGTHIKRVDRFDEVTNHLLQVFVAQQMRKKGVLTSSELKPSA